MGLNRKAVEKIRVMKIATLRLAEHASPGMGETRQAMPDFGAKPGDLDSVHALCQAG